MPEMMTSATKYENQIFLQIPKLRKIPKKHKAVQ